MYLTRKVGPKGQVVIPQELRDELGIVPGSEVSFDIDATSGSISLAPLNTGSALEEFLSLAKIPDKSKNLTVKQIKKLIYEEVGDRNGLR